MFKLSKKSQERLETCDERLITIVREVCKVMDVTVLCGHRGKEEQEKAFNEGKSRAHFGQSYHNASPSLAVDIAPYPINWDVKDPRWEIMCNLVLYIANRYRINVKLGRDFTNLKDYPHIEIG